jgi:licheninase
MVGMSQRSSIVAAAMLMGVAALPQTAHAQTTTRPAGWGAPVLVENFNGSSINTNRWMIYHSPQAERNPRTGKAASVANGVLRLKGGMYGGKDLSGGVATRLAQRYGRWEVRLKAEAGAGYTPVALLWPTSQGEEGGYSEVDFAEIVDPARKGGGIFVHSGQGRARRVLRADFTQWHTVAVDRLPGRLTFWLDGRKVWDYRGSHVPDAGKMGLALQNDVVCEPRCRDSGTPRTVSMYVDWVKIYRAS